MLQKTVDCPAAFERDAQAAKPPGIVASRHNSPHFQFLLIAQEGLFGIIPIMTKLLEEAVAQLRTLPEDEQDRAAKVLLAFAHDRRDYTFDAEQIKGIRHAMGQADKGEFASDKRLRNIFGRAL